VSRGGSPCRKPLPRSCSNDCRPGE
jgi:hypothetical protein